MKIRIKTFTSITLILVFFFLGQHIRALVNIATGNHLAGALVDDIVIVGLVFFYATYALSVRTISGLWLDRVKLFLLAVFAVAVFQATHLAIMLPGDVNSVLFRASYSFRKYFMPFALLFVFSYLIRNEIIKNGESFIKRLVKLFDIFLWVAISYNILEAVLRTTVPEFNSFYLNRYILNTLLQAGAPTIHAMEDIPIAVLAQLNGPSIRRVYGICLEMYMTGSIIFLCYLYHVFMSGKFRVLSILNGLVFVALLLSGSRTCIVPFLVLNTVIFVRRCLRKNLLAPILIGMLLVGGVSLMIPLMGPTFSYPGYFWYVQEAVNPIIQNLGLFIFGTGPVGFTPWGQKISWLGDLNYAVSRAVGGLGLLTIVLEAGLIMSALFVLFHIFVFRISGNISGCRQPRDQYTNRLKIVIVLNMLVGVAHWPTLFDRTIIVFHVFLIALLYSWSRLRIISFAEASGKQVFAGHLESGTNLTGSS